MLQRLLPGAFAAAIFLAAGAPARAQDSQVLMPEQSAAKAKELIQEMIQTLGGSAYLNVKDESCEGRAAQFGHSGALSDYDVFYDFTKFPDKDRTEFSKKRNIIEIYNGNQGWVLDRGGVTDAPPDSVTENQRELGLDIDHILQYRLNETGMIFRYDGPDVVDLKEADWVELDDSEGREIRIAIAKLTHLPIRKEVAMRDPQTHMRAEEVDYYSNFHEVDGVQIPFQVTHIRNGLKVFQIFYQSCKFNTGLADSLFTKESLDQRWAQVGKKSKKNKKDKS
jgi:outer membrane lipoprotein-sorting protein